MDKIGRQLAGVVLAGRELAEVLQEITEIAAESLPGADSCSITLIRGEEPFTAAYVGALSLEADELQYKRGYGPCMDAGRTATVLYVDDMREEQRWPDYAADVVSRGVRSSLSVPLPFQGACIGALNSYALVPHALRKDVPAAEEVASFIAVAVANADAFATTSTLAAQMQDAMKSRAVIDMAKGILMAQRRCGPDAAFTILSQASQRSNRKLREIAAAVVAGVQEDAGA